MAVNMCPTPITLHADGCYMKVDEQQLTWSDFGQSLSQGALVLGRLLR